MHVPCRSYYCSGWILISPRSIDWYLRTKKKKKKNGSSISCKCWRTLSHGTRLHCDCKPTANKYIKWNFHHGTANIASRLGIRWPILAELSFSHRNRSIASLYESFTHFVLFCSISHWAPPAYTSVWEWELNNLDPYPLVSIMMNQFILLCERVCERNRRRRRITNPLKAKSKTTKQMQRVENVPWPVVEVRMGP